MLDLLTFKRSLFAGVLEDGADQVLLGGTRLTRFMESVETATTTIPSPMPVETAGSLADAAAAQETAPEDERDDGQQAPAPKDATAPAGSLEQLVAAGTSFLDQLSRFVAAAQAAPSGQDDANRVLTTLVGRDAKTGQAYLRLPIPSEDTRNQIVGALGALAKALGREL
jgi:hypothetical protein